MQPDAVIDALSHLDAYPERPAEVAVGQTHISWLFFTPEHVYKVKKPVDFGFLDFTTLEARKMFCEEEARLNRRLAPQVYLDVMEVKASDGRIHLGGPGETVEYALQMRRLPDDRMLPALLSSGQVSSQILECLARLVADFHARAETGGDIDHAGEPAAILNNWQENFAQTQPYLDFPLPRRAWDEIRRRVLAFCRLREALFRQRIAAGRIRDGHGDLRAEHICVTDPIVIFDCIEFNRRFRYGDVAADIAFLAMDLEALGFPDFANIFVQAYVEYSRDCGLLHVLEFYKCYRAFVRAKVACFRADDPAVPAGQQRLALQAVYRYSQLAARYAGALRRPWLLLACGLMGTGKSVLAEALAPKLDLHILSSDVTRKQLAGLPPPTRQREAYGEGLYNADRTEATYAELFRKAEPLLSAGHSVLIDASFHRASHRLQARRLAAEAGAEFRVLECWCPEEVLHQRLQARSEAAATPSDGRLELLAQQRQTFEALLDVPPQQHLRVDTTPAPEVVAEWVACALTSEGSWSHAGSPPRGCQ
jgi:uncharacterized protein